MSDSRQDILTYGRLCCEQGLIINVDGNLSVRGQKGIWISPAGSDKACLCLEDLALVDGGGQALNDRRASSELKIHLAIYDRWPEAEAVLHTHPLYSTALTLSDEELEPGLLTEARAHLEPLAYVADLEPGSQALCQAVEKAICSDVQGLILRGHGLVTWGPRMEAAYRQALSVERLAQTQFIRYAAGLG